MVSLIVHLVLGIGCIAWIVRANQHVFARPASGPMFSPLEIVFYVIGVASIVLGYYFNHQFVADYAVPGGNPIWGPGSWQQFIQLGYVNSAAASQVQDYTIINVDPAAAVHDRRRLPARHPPAVAVLRVEPVHQLRVRVRVLLRGARSPAPPRQGGEGARLRPRLTACLQLRAWAFAPH